MKRHAITALGELELRLRGSVVTIGVFDGLHLGHQAILDRLVAAAQRRRLPAVCITFSVHPRSVLAGQAPQQILSLEHRLELLEARGIEHCIVIEFGPGFASLEAATFVEELLVRRLGVAELVIGHDTAVGKGRQGDAAFLGEAGVHYGFAVVALGEVLVDGMRVSSTAVRRAITSGDLQLARRLLGRPVSLLGRIVHGDGRGARIGFPTANLEVTSEAFPPLGVYAVTARTRLGELPGVMNYGLRPTFHQAAEHAVFEVHLLDLPPGEVSLYGERMEVELHEYLRREQRFASVEELSAQIRRDVEAARVVLGRRPG